MKTKTRKLFLSLFAFFSLAVTACGGGGGGSSGGGDSSDTSTTSQSETSSGSGGSSSSSSTSSEPEEDTNLYVKVDDEDEEAVELVNGKYTIANVYLTGEEEIQIYVKDISGNAHSIIEDVELDPDSVQYIDVDATEETVSVTAAGTYTFEFTVSDDVYELSIEYVVDPSKVGFAIKIGNTFKALPEVSIEPSETAIDEKFMLEHVALTANQQVSFYVDGEVLPVQSDTEDYVNVNNINEHTVTADTTTPFTIHNNADATVYFKHITNVGYRFWITGFQGESPIPSPWQLHIKRAGNDQSISLVENPGNKGEVMKTGVELQDGDSIYIDMGNSDYRHIEELNGYAAAPLFEADTSDHDNLKLKEGNAGTYDFYIKKEKGEYHDSIVIVQQRSSSVTTTEYAANLGDEFGGDHVVYVYSWGYWGAESNKLTDLSKLPIKSDVNNFVVVSFAEGTTSFDWDEALAKTGDVTPNADPSKIFKIDTYKALPEVTTYHWGDEIEYVNYLDLWRGENNTKTELVPQGENEYKILGVSLEAGDVLSFCVVVDEANEWSKFANVKDESPVYDDFKAHDTVETTEPSYGNIEVVNSGTYSFYVLKHTTAASYKTVYITEYVDRSGWKAYINTTETAVTETGDNDNQIEIKNLQLEAGDEIIFKKTSASLEKGYAQIKDACPAATFFEEGADNVLKVKAGGEGTYEFYVDVTASKAIWIVKQGYVPPVDPTSYLYLVRDGQPDTKLELVPNTATEMKIENTSLQEGDIVSFKVDGDDTWKKYSNMNIGSSMVKTQYIKECTESGSNYGNAIILREGTYSFYVKTDGSNEVWFNYSAIIPSGATTFDLGQNWIWNDEDLVYAKATGGTYDGQWIAVQFVDTYHGALNYGGATSLQFVRVAKGTTIDQVETAPKHNTSTGVNMGTKTVTGWAS